MACTSYEIGILNAVQGQMLLRTWTVAELEHGIPWLKRVNAHGHDIYIRPDGSVGLVLLDDVDAAAIARLKDDGLAPAAVVETSPGNYQAWLRVSQQPIAPEQATRVARILAERYGGDPASADWRHFGRLAGFTNRKPKHRKESGLQPFVLVREAAGIATERGAQLLEEAEARLQATAAAQSAVSRVPPLSPAPHGLRTPGAAYALYAERIMARYPNTDLSRLDWMVCCDLAEASLAVDEQYLQHAVREGSPQLAQRKAGHVDDYVARTASKVMCDIDVLAARERLASGDGLLQLGADPRGAPAGRGKGGSQGECQPVTSRLPRDSIRRAPTTRARQVNVVQTSARMGTTPVRAASRQQREVLCLTAREHTEQGNGHSQCMDCPMKLTHVRGAAVLPIEKERPMRSDLPARENSPRRDDRQRFLEEAQAAADYIAKHVKVRMIPATHVMCDADVLAAHERLASDGPLQGEQGQSS